MIPIYAPMPTLSFDRVKIQEEIERLCLPHAVERSVVFAKGKNVYDTSIDLKISTESKLLDTTYYVESESGQRTTVKGQYSTYHVLNLTRLPGDKNSEWLTYFERNGLKLNYWHHFLQPWVWMPELESTYLRSYIESLPFEYVQTVRLVSMSPPAIGQVHVDAIKKANRNWLESGFASVTLNVSHGGSYMRFSDGRNAHVADPATLVSHFDDAYHHGVPELSSVRHQIRIFGKMDTKTYLDLMDLERAIWNPALIPSRAPELHPR